MCSFLNYWPVSALVILVLVNAVALGGQRRLDRKFLFEERKERAEVLGHLAGITGVINAVLFAFIKGGEAMRNTLDRAASAMLIIGVLVATGHVAFAAQSLGVARPSLMQLTQQRQTVPDLYGMSVGAAIDKLRSVGLQANIGSEPSNEMSCVGSQKPPAGTVVGVGTVVELGVSSCQRVTVPDLRTMTLGQAQDVLGGQRLSLGNTRYVNSDQAAGTVVGQSPTAGTSVLEQTRVSLDLSQGPTATAPPIAPPSTPRLVVVPKLVGRPVATAEAIVRKSGLNMGGLSQQVSGLPVGTVTGQQPAAGSRVSAGTEVQLTVAAAPLVVPDLKGLTQAEAEARLTSAGFTLGALSHRASRGPAGRVVGQQPVAGSQYVRTTSVALVLSSSNLVSVPSVRGLTLASARAALRAHGLSVGALTPQQVGMGRIVDRQSPAAHARVELGASVDLFFAPDAARAQILTPDTVLTAGQTATIEVDLSPGAVATAYHFSFGDGDLSEWTPSPRVQHAYKKPGSYFAKAAIRLDDGEVIFASAVPIRVRRNLTSLLTVLVLAVGLGWPLLKFVPRLLTRAPLPVPHVALIPRPSSDASVASTVGPHAVWSLAIVAPGALGSCNIERLGPDSNPRRNS